jgi:hypothetical protein
MLSTAEARVGGGLRVTCKAHYIVIMRGYLEDILISGICEPKSVVTAMWLDGWRPPCIVLLRIEIGSYQSQVRRSLGGR